MHLVNDVASKDFQIRVPLMSMPGMACISISLDDSEWDGAYIKLTSPNGNDEVENAISLSEVRALISSLTAIKDILTQRQEYNP